MKTRSRAAAWLIALALLAAGCSSTTKGHKAAAALSLDRGGQASAAGAQADQSGSSGAGPAGASGAAGAGAPAASAGTGAGAARTGPAAGTSAKSAAAAGVEPILIGNYGHSATTLASEGINNASLGDPTKLAQVMINWVNSHGGAAGRPLKLVPAQSPLVGGDAAASDQAACAKFTEDNHVFAVASVTVPTPGFYDCIMRHHVMMFYDSVTQPNAAYFARYHDLLYSGDPSTDRIGAVTADALNRMGYFADAGAKRVGTVNLDHPWFQSSTDAFKREAAKYGVSVAVEVKICQGCSSAESSNEAQNGIVKLRAAGIDHVVLLGSTTGFAQTAQANGYLPRYGLSSQVTPVLSALQTPPQTWKDAVGAGYMPAVDVNAAQEPPASPELQLCKQILAQAGFQEQDRLQAVQFRMTCDTYFFLKMALDRAGRADLATVQTAVESLGSGYHGSVVWKSFYGPGRHDGPQTYRRLAFDLTGCQCFHYVGSDEFPFPPLPGQPT